MARLAALALLALLASPAAAYTVRGNQIVDAAGRPHRLRGLARPSLEWSPRGVELSGEDFGRMAEWGANVVRVSLNQDFWLAGAARHDRGYEATVARVVRQAHAAGLDVILDLHWSDRGDLKGEPGQQRMADRNSVTFWREVAAVYKADPRVLFELYNEPHDVSWEVWLRGGASGEGWEVAGMQALNDAVRAAGAENVVLVAGLEWAYDLRGVPEHRVQGRNVAYVSHTYDGWSHRPGDWESHFGFLAATDPVVVTEFGSTDGTADYDLAFVRYADQKGLSWTAWAWYPGGAKFPALIQDWRGTPTAPGEVVRTALGACMAPPPRTGLAALLDHVR